MEELIKAILIQLFILSLISERITNFIKLNLQTLIERYGSKGLSDRLGNLRNRESTEDKEKQRERGILNWAIVVSILVANAVSADIFYLMTDGKLQPQWKFSSMLGYCLTGLFISLGSKFWHDLLDIVLYTSNLKRKLADTTQFQQIDRIEQVDEFVNLFPSQVAQMALVQWKEQISSDELSNVFRVNSGIRRINGEVRPCLYVYLKDNKIPTDFKFSVEHKTGLKSPIEVLFIPRSDFPKPHLASGDTLVKVGGNLQGTLCCIVKNNFTTKKYALTCRHVMDSVFKLVDGEVASPKPKVESNGQTIGSWEHQIFNNDYDVALIEIDEINITPTPYIQTPRVLDQSDVRSTQVTVITRGGIEKKGVLVNIHTNRMIPFDFTGQIHEFDELLELATTDDPWTSRALTHEGDSGAMVYDSLTKKPLGMIIGGNLDSSFAIPIQKILNKVVCQIHVPT